MTDPEPDGDLPLGAADALRLVDARIEHLNRVVDRERAARVARRDLQRLAAASVAATTIDEVLITIVQGARDVLASHITSVALPTDDGQVRFVHVDGAPDDLVADWTTCDPDVEVPLVQALAPGSTWIELLDREEIAEWPLLAADAGRADIGTYVAIPLRSRTTREPIAALGIGFRTETMIDALDRAVMAELSELASDAIERAGALQHARSVAETLQHALLPRRLPKVDGLTLRSLYEPCAHLTDVGGDWYDVVRLDDGAVGLVVGDVAGHDAASAAEMGRIRHVVASHLLEHGDPGTALTLADRYFASVDDSTFATAVVMVLDAERSVVTLASAGHLPPLLVCAGLATRVDVDPGPPIGSGLGGHRCTAATLPLDATLVAFTDGLIERRGRAIDESLDELAERLAALRDHGSANLLRALRDHLDSPDRDDDAAALIATRS